MGRSKVSFTRSGSLAWSAPTNSTSIDFAGEKPYLAKLEVFRLSRQLQTLQEILAELAPFHPQTIGARR